MEVTKEAIESSPVFLHHQSSLNLTLPKSSSSLIKNNSAHDLTAKSDTKPKEANTNTNTSEIEDENGSKLDVETVNLTAPVEIDSSNVNFSQNREQWQKRASTQPTTPGGGAGKDNKGVGVDVRQNHTPDLVMDLPLVGNSSPKDSSKKTISLNPEDAKTTPSPTGPESPDMSTAAERFAKQNQCTLKKNTKIHLDPSVDNTISEIMPITSPVHDRKYLVSNNSSTTTFKPQIKAKPPMLKKPVFSVPLATVPAEIIRQDPENLPI